MNEIVLVNPTANEVFIDSAFGCDMLDDFLNMLDRPTEKIAIAVRGGIIGDRADYVVIATFIRDGRYVESLFRLVISEGRRYIKHNFTQQSHEA